MKMFPDRSLISISHPLAPSMEGDVTKLESDGNEPSPGQMFVEDAQRLQNKFLNDTPAKQIWSKTITGSMLANLLYEYI